MTTLFKAVRREVRKGRVRTSLLLNSLAEQLDELASAQERGAEKCGDEEGATLLSSSATVTRKVADNIRLHALTHVGEPPVPLPPEAASLPETK